MKTQGKTFTVNGSHKKTNPITLLRKILEEQKVRIDKESFDKAESETKKTDLYIEGSMSNIFGYLLTIANYNARFSVNGIVLEKVKSDED